MNLYNVNRMVMHVMVITGFVNLGFCAFAGETNQPRNS